MDIATCESGNDDAMKSCHQPKAPETEEKEYCNKTETTCICIYCFQFASSTPTNSKYVILQSAIKNHYGSYHPSHWKDPFISIPWQPPDVS